MTIWIEKLAVKMLSNNEFEITDTETSTKFQISVREYTRGYFAAVLNYGVCVIFEENTFDAIEHGFIDCDHLIVKRYAEKLATVIMALNDKGALSLVDML